MTQNNKNNKLLRAVIEKFGIFLVITLKYIIFNLCMFGMISLFIIPGIILEAGLLILLIRLIKLK